VGEEMTRKRRKRWLKKKAKIRARARVTALYPGITWDEDRGLRPGKLVAVGEWW
jgi:hypothetical protein